MVEAKRDFLFLENCCCKLLKETCFSAAQCGTAGELEASRSKFALRKHERCETRESLRVYEDVVRYKNTKMIRYLMTFLMKGFDKDHSSHK